MLRQTLTKFCGACGMDRVHNLPSDPKREPRCTGCGRPYRTQGNIWLKNLVSKRMWDGKIFFGTTTP